MLNFAPLVLIGCAGWFAQRPPAPAGDADAGVVEIYDLRDLALPSALRHLIAPEPAAAAARPRGGSEAGGGDSEAALAKLLRDPPRSKEGGRDAVSSDFAAWKLMETLVQCVAARVGAPTTCQANENGALVVHAGRDTQRAIRDLIASVRRADDSLPVGVRVLELDRSAQALLEQFAAARAVDAAAAPASPPVSSPTPAELDRLLAHAGTKVVAAPSLLTPELDGFEVEIAVPIAYVESHSLRSIEGIGTITEPVIREARPGTRVRGRCVEAMSSSSGEPPPFALRLEVEVSELKKPIAQQTTELGTIQLPELKRAMISTTVAGSAGRPLLIGGVPKPAFDEEGATHRLYVLVTVGAPRRGG